MEQNEILEETRRCNELLRGQLLWMRAAAALLLLWLREKTSDFLMRILTWFLCGAQRTCIGL